MFHVTDHFFVIVELKSRDAEILDLLQDRWLQIVNDGGLISANEGVITVKDDSQV